MSKGTHWCSAVNCFNNRSNTKSLSFFQFPFNPERGNSMPNHPDGETTVSGICVKFTSQEDIDEMNTITKFYVFSVQTSEVMTG